MTKFLGILIDYRLNWTEHNINLIVVCSKLSKRFAIMYNAKQLVDNESLLMLYNSVFVPYLS